MYMTLEGIYGTAVNVSSTLIILFTIYGAFLQFSGAGKFFIDFSFSAMGGKPTSAGRTVTLASFLLGGPSGSGVATTVTLGAVAAPMLAKVGYSKEEAGGLLAAGGLGAIISPPVLGAAAFIIAEFLKISYLDVVLMAVIPTGLFYLTLFIMVEIDVRKFGMRAVSFEQVESAWSAVEALLVPLPVAGLDRRLHADGLLAGAVGVLGDGGGAGHQLPAARHRARPVRVLEKKPGARIPRLGLGQGAEGRLPFRAQRRGDLRRRRHHRRRGDAHRTRAQVQLDRPRLRRRLLLLTAIYTALIVWIVGLAVPVTASYIICAVIAAPALIALKVPEFAAHMFIFYYAVLSEVSPPTALSPFAAAAITGGGPYRTTLQCWKYTTPAFLVPFMFVLDPSGTGLLLTGSFKTLATANWGSIALVTFTAAVGILALAGALPGLAVQEDAGLRAR